MQVVDRLSAIAATIGDNSISTIQLQVLRQIANHEPRVTHELCVFVGQGSDRSYRPLGNDQHMRGRLRRNIVKGQATIILINDLCRDFFVNNALKDRFLGHIWIDHRFAGRSHAP